MTGVQLPTAPKGVAVHCKSTAVSTATASRAVLPVPPPGGPAHCRTFAARCPQAVWPCIRGVALPPAPGRCGSALQKLHYLLPPGSEAVHCKSCTAHYLQGTAVVHCRSSTAKCPFRSGAVHGRSYATHCPTPQWGSALQEFHCPVPRSSGAMHCNSLYTDCLQALWQCIAPVPLPTAPKQ